MVQTSFKRTGASPLLFRYHSGGIPRLVTWSVCHWWVLPCLGHFSRNVSDCMRTSLARLCCLRSCSFHCSGGTGPAFLAILVSILVLDRMGSTRRLAGSRDRDRGRHAGMGTGCDFPSAASRGVCGIQHARLRENGMDSGCRADRPKRVDVHYTNPRVDYGSPGTRAVPTVLGDVLPEAFSSSATRPCGW